MQLSFVQSGEHFPRVPECDLSACACHELCQRGCYHWGVLWLLQCGLGAPWSITRWLSTASPSLPGTGQGLSTGRKRHRSCTPLKLPVAAGLNLKEAECGDSRCGCCRLADGQGMRAWPWVRVMSGCG